MTHPSSLGHMAQQGWCCSPEDNNDDDDDVDEDDNDNDNEDNDDYVSGCGIFKDSIYYQTRESREWHWIDKW